MALQKVNYESQTDSYWVNLKPDELKLVAAFLFNFRLGNGNKFKSAAFDLMQGIDSGCPPDFTEQAADEIGLYAALEDADGNIGATIDSPYLTFEVSGGFAGMNFQKALPAPTTP